MKKQIIVVFGALLLSSCGQVAVSSTETSKASDSASPSASSVDLACSDLRTALSKLRGIRNYSLNISASNSRVTYNRYYTENYVYEDKTDAELGYVCADEGVFRISKLDEEFVGSELLKDKSGAVYTDLWSSGLFRSFADFKDEFASGVTSGKMTSKINILYLLSILDYSGSDYPSVSSVKVSIADSLNTLEFQLFMASSYSVTCLVQDVGNTTATEVVDYLKNGGQALTPDGNLLKARDLFKTNNYNRDVLDFSTNASVGTEHFMPTYFYGDYTAAASWGLLGIKNKTISGSVSTSAGTSQVSYTLNGAYYFVISGGAVSPHFADVYNASWDIPSKDVYNYPSNLLIWSCFERLKTVGVDRAYQVVDKNLLADFVNNYQLGTIISEAGASVVSLDIVMKDMSYASAQVTFNLNYVLSGAMSTMSFPMKSFGAANVKTVDDFISTYHLG